MTVYFHIGPHKTGTSVIQRALSRNRHVVYPPVERAAPGHAVLAWRAMGKPGRPPEPDLLVDVVRQHARPDKPFILSSEVFSWASMAGRSPEALRRLADTFPVQLIITLTPLVGRAVSSAQEIVKHGHPLDFEDEAVLRETLMTQPGLQPDVLERLRGLARWNGIDLVLVDRSRPARIFEIFSEILGVPVEHDPADREYENKRFPYAEIAMLSLLCRLAPDAELTKQRWAARHAVLAAARDIPELATLSYPPLPPAFAAELEASWARQLALIDAWAAAGEIRLHR